MKHDHPHHDPKPKKSQIVSGTYRQPIFSPRGGLEGLLLDIDGAPAQVVLEPREPFAALSDLTVGQLLELEVVAAPPSPKGEAAHALYHLRAVISIDGRKPLPTEAAQTRFTGRVVRLNYAKHGEPNGVVLDSGDFIHLRPQGFRAVGLKLGDSVQAHGEAQPMAGGGFVVEASRVNAVAIEPKKPKPKPHGPRHGHEHGPKAAHATH